MSIVHHVVGNRRRSGSHPTTSTSGASGSVTVSVSGTKAERMLFVGPRIPIEIKRMVKPIQKLDKSTVRKCLQGKKFACCMKSVFLGTTSSDLIRYLV